MNLNKDEIISDVLAKFEKDLTEARTPTTPQSIERFNDNGFKYAGMVAALTSAAVKRAKVRLVDAYLKGSKLDLTITSAEKVFVAVLGRSVSQRNKGEYATTGRTAMHKTTITPEQIEALSAEIKPALKRLIAEMEHIKEKVKASHAKE